MNALHAPGIIASCLALVSLGCTEAMTELVSDDGDPDAGQAGDARTASDSGFGDSALGNGDPGDASLPDAFGDGEPVLCNNKPCACDNDDDDDGDGLSDGLDPECTGPFDDDESSFATGSPGDSREQCQDCFFDGNSGHGDDGCKVGIDCLYGRVPESLSNGSCLSCEVSAECVESCLPSTPNGCDCFGCCELFRGDGSRLNVLLNPACSVDRIEDEVACPRCIPSAACSNPCGTCELCPGKGANDLPDYCARAGGEPGPDYTCDNGERVCSNAFPCPETFYCHMGCCLQAIF